MYPQRFRVKVLIVQFSLKTLSFFFKSESYCFEKLSETFALPFQVLLGFLEIFWLKFLHYEVFNVRAGALSCSLASFFIIWHPDLFVNIFFSFSLNFFRSLPRHPSSSSTPMMLSQQVFLPAVSKHSFCIIPKGLILVNTLFGFFSMFFSGSV